jgi:hypothetical protein
MRLNVTALDDVRDVNNYRYVTEVSSTAGDPIELYFQLSDATKNLTQYGFSPSGLRYMPVAGSTLQVIFLNIDNSKQFNRFASQPFVQDSSIWRVPVLATDPVLGTVSLKFILTEPNGTVGGVVKTCHLNACFSACDNTSNIGNPRPESSFGY